MFFTFIFAVLVRLSFKEVSWGVGGDTSKRVHGGVWKERS